MGLLNRFALTLRPREPFLGWVNGHPQGKLPLVHTLEHIREDPTVYLIQDCETVDEGRQWVYGEFEFFFKEQLEAWWTDEESWPKNRTLEMFKEWFDIEVLSSVDNVMDDDVQEDLIEE